LLIKFVIKICHQLISFQKSVKKWTSNFPPNPIKYNAFEGEDKEKELKSSKVELVELEEAEMELNEESMSKKLKEKKKKKKKKESNCCNY